MTILLWVGVPRDRSLSHNIVLCNELSVWNSWSHCSSGIFYCLWSITTNGHLACHSAALGWWITKRPCPKIIQMEYEIAEAWQNPVPVNYYWGTFRNLQLLIIGGSSQEISSAVALLRALVNSLNRPKTELAVVLGKSRVRAMKTKTPKSWKYKLR